MTTENILIMKTFKLKCSNGLELLIYLFYHRSPIFLLWSISIHVYFRFGGWFCCLFVFIRNFFLSKQENIKVTSLGFVASASNFPFQILLTQDQMRAFISHYICCPLIQSSSLSRIILHTHIHPCIHSVIEQYLTVAIRPLEIKEEIYLVIFTFLPGSSQKYFWFKCFLLIRFYKSLGPTQNVQIFIFVSGVEISSMD